MKRILQLLLCLVVIGLNVLKLEAKENINFEQDYDLLYVINDISKRYDVYFTYDREVVEGLIVKHYEPETYVNVDEAIKVALKDTKLEFVMLQNKYVIIYQNDEEGMESLKEMIGLMQGIVEKKDIALRKEMRQVKKLNPPSSKIVRKLQTRILDISGKVLDGNGLPLIGVNVLVKGSNIGTATDIDGSFNLNEVDKAATLVFSYIGYQTQEVQIAGKSFLEVILIEDSQSLDEVIVVGYGTQKKSDLTGAIGSLKGDDLNLVASHSPVEAMQGRVAGVSIVRNSGVPGDDFKVRIRGITSINDSDPLYVIDGIPSNSMNNINANDIENIEILKDASSTAIYGSRGASGVVLVTTKSGKRGSGPSFSLNSYIGYNHIDQIEMTNGYENAMLHIEALENDGTDVSGEVADIFNQAISSKAEGVNGQDYVLRRGALKSHQFSVQGSTGSSHQFIDYYLSGSYTDEEGTIKFTEYDRTNVLAKLRFGVNRNIQWGIETRYVNESNLGFDSQPGRSENPLAQALWGNPNEPLINPDGSWGEMIVNQFHNNAAHLVQDTRFRTHDRFSLLNIGWAEVSIWNKLKFKTTVSYSNGSRYLKDFRESYEINPSKARPESFLDEQRVGSSGWVWNNVLTYQEEVLKNHNLTLMLGHEAQHSNSNGFGIIATSGVREEEQLRYLDQATLWSAPNTYIGQSGLESYFGRFVYSIKGKYIVNGILRTDGSYKFPKQNRWGTFPSIGLAWNVGEENFIRNLNLFDNLKLRFNWGRVGNQASASAFAYISSISTNNMFYTFDGLNPFRGGISSDTPNPDLKWETIESSNYAIDMGFLQNRLTFSADYYIKKTSDMIIRVPVPMYTSNFEPLANVGDMVNKGLELSSGYVQNIGKFGFNIGANISFNKNEVISLGSKAFIDGGSQPDITPSNITRTEPGEEVGYFRGYEYAGIYKNQAEIDASGLSDVQIGDAIFVDQNNDGIIDEDDLIKIGSPHPDFIYGINGGLSYMGFDFAFNIIGSEGNDIFDPFKVMLSRGQGYGGLLKERLDRYHPENNPDGDQPRMSLLDPNQNYRKLSALLIEDGSFLKIKNIQLGYSAPEKLTRMLRLTKARVYVTGQNLLTFTEYSGFDPEISALNPSNSNSILAAGINVANYPIPKSMILGVNISF